MAPPGTSPWQCSGLQHCQHFVHPRAVILRLSDGGEPQGFKRDALMASFAALACLAVVLYGRMGMALGLLFVVSLLAYIVFVYLQERQSPDQLAAVAEHRGGRRPKRPADHGFFVGNGRRWHSNHDFWRTFFGGWLDCSGQGVGGVEHDHRPDDRGGGHVHARVVTSVMAAIRNMPMLAYGNIVGSTSSTRLFIWVPPP